MAPGDSILLYRAEIELIASAGFQASAPKDLAERLMVDVGQAGRGQTYSLPLTNIRKSLAEALRNFADETRGTQDAVLADDLAGKIERLP